MGFRVRLEPLVGGSAKPQIFSVCDIEAYKWTEFRIIGWYNGDEYLEFRTLYDFIEHCWEQFDNEDEKVIYAHFGGIYDFMFIIKAILQDTDYRIKDMIPRGSGLLGFSLCRERPDGKFDKIQFKDSSAMLPFSLANLTKSFGVKHKKQDFDFFAFPISHIFSSNKHTSWHRPSQHSINGKVIFRFSLFCNHSTSPRHYSRVATDP